MKPQLLNKGKAVRTKQPSQKLQQVMNAIASDFGKLQARVNEAFDIGKSEGFTEPEIGSLIREKMIQAGYARQTIARVLPLEAKCKPRGKPGGRFSNKMLLTATATTTEEKEKCVECGKLISPYIRSNGGHCAECVEILNRESNESMQQQQEIQQQPKGDLTTTQQQQEEEQKPPITENERRSQIIQKIDLDNFNFHTVGTILDSCTAEELRIILENALSVNSQLKRNLKQKTESLEKSTKDYRNLRDKFKLCEMCDKKGTDDETPGFRYCPKHLKQVIKLNKDLAPLAKSLFGAAMEASKKKVSK